MKQSIENIWKEGFADESLTAPSKINSLYDKKSLLLINKLKASTKKDNISLIPISLVLFILFSVIGKVHVGLYSTAVLILLFINNKKLLDRLFAIQESSNCYDYLTALRGGIKSTIRKTIYLMIAAPPLVFGVGVWLYFLEDPIPKTAVTVLVVLSMISPILGLIGYHLSNQIIYGPTIKNINTIIREMEELRN